MIKFIDLSQDKPYEEFRSRYDAAFKMNQKNIEAMCISSYSKKLNEVNSRYVNLKILSDKDLIFFSNYNSPKAREFGEHNQITAIIYWNTINTQIRIKAFIKKNI
jgi:pyridoxine/pyridoxamine 5'-phosphate oxidase